MKASWSPLLASLLLLVATVDVGAARVPAQADHVPASELDPALRAAVEEEVANAIRDTLGIRSRQHLFRSLRIGVCGNVAIVELSPAFLPEGLEHLSAELEDGLHMITTTILWTAESEFGVALSGVLYTFDGKPLPYYYPADYRPEDVDALVCE